MLDQMIFQKVRELPTERQQQVLDFVEFLGHWATVEPKRKRHRIKGMLADFKTDITFEDTKELRREMWKNLRDIEL